MRKPHPDLLVEQLFKDVELHGWWIIWDDAKRHFRVACPHDGRFVYAWPVALEPGGSGPTTSGA